MKTLLALLLLLTLLLPAAALAQDGGDDEGERITLGEGDPVALTLPEGWVWDDSAGPVLYTLASTETALDLDTVIAGEAGEAAILAVLLPYDSETPLEDEINALLDTTTADLETVDTPDYNESTALDVRALRSQALAYTADNGSNDNDSSVTVQLLGAENDELRVILLYIAPQDEAGDALLDPAATIFDSLTLLGVNVPPAAGTRETQVFDALLGITSLSIDLPPTWVAQVAEDGAALDIASNVVLLESTRTQPISQPAEVEGASIAISILGKETFGALDISLLDLWGVLAGSIANTDGVQSDAPVPTFIGEADALRASVDAPAGSGTIYFIDTASAYLLVIALGNPTGEFDTVIEAVVESIVVE